MTRQVKKTTATDSAGNTIKTRTVHKERPRKTVDKIVQRESGPSGTARTRAKTVTRKK
jgi:hypothetical protein